MDGILCGGQSTGPFISHCFVRRFRRRLLEWCFETSRAEQFGTNIPARTWRRLVKNFVRGRPVPASHSLQSRNPAAASQLRGGDLLPASDRSVGGCSAWKETTAKGPRLPRPVGFRAPTYRCVCKPPTLWKIFRDGQNRERNQKLSQSEACDVYANYHKCFECHRARRRTRSSVQFHLPY